MRPETAEWVEKAENDFRAMCREVKVTDSPSHDVVCFLAQQCAEKYLKALLTEADIPFAKTHDLSLLARLLPETSAYPGLAEMLARLGPCAVEFRYPGASADRALADDASEDARDVRAWARKSLHLDEDS
jgi:HEPN domain-containing protein